MASASRVIYVGVTNSLERRVWEHKNKTIEGFTKKYNCAKLVWFDEFREIRDVIACEKRIKGLLRAKKVALIEEGNPYWKDVSDGWYEIAQPKSDGDLRRTASRPTRLSLRSE
jgi:putative endonuclease